MRFLRRLRERKDVSPHDAHTPWPPAEARAEADAVAPSPRAVFAAGGIELPALWYVGAVDAERPVWTFVDTSGTTLDWWRRLRPLHGETGWWPLLLGQPGDWSFEEWSDPDSNGDAEVARGLARDVDVRLAEVVAGFPEWDGVPPHGPAEPVAAVTADDVPLASSPGLLGLVRARAGYHVPGVVGWTGAANHRLTGADHVAVLKRWHDRWGAELVGLGHAELDVTVSRPPRHEDEAMAVATEQYRYCPDVVEEHGTIEVFAARQVRGYAWHFWWD